MISHGAESSVPGAHSKDGLVSWSPTDRGAPQAQFPSGVGGQGTFPQGCTALFLLPPSQSFSAVLVDSRTAVTLFSSFL